MTRVDTLGFLAPQGMNPEADPALAENIDFIHVTAAAPMLKEVSSVLFGKTMGPHVFPGLGDFRKQIEEQSNLAIIETSQDLDNSQSNGRTGVILGLQETPYDITHPSLKDIYDLGVRIMTLSYQDPKHPLGSGYVDPRGLLTSKGVGFLLNCDDVGMTLDLSHVGHQTARNVMDFREGEGLDFPVMASHGGIYELYDGPNKNVPNNLRNLPLEILQRIAEVGGIVGIYALTFGLSEKDDTPGPMLSQIRYAIENIGVNSVSIGTDSVYQKRQMNEWEQATERLTQLVVRTGELEPRFPDVPIELNRVDKMSVIETALADEGVDDEVVAKVIGDNARKFFEKVL